MPDEPIRSAAVFCGSRFGGEPEYRRASAALGAGLARAGIRLVYGGGHVGLMGVVADAVLGSSGTVLGVIPDFLRRREVAHEGAVTLVVTETMHDRKQRMFQEADVFITMPGGLGTFDETIEIITWRQLGLHDKPILICDVGGWAAGLRATLDAAIGQGFAPADNARLYEFLPDVPAVLARLAEFGAAGAGQPEKV